MISHCYNKAFSISREKVYLGTGSGSATTFTFAGQSNVNSGTVDFNYVSNLSSFFHNHYAGNTAGQGNLLATFSNQDVVEFFKIATNNIMADQDDFTMLLVTPQQDLQAVMVSDATTFNAKVNELKSGSSPDVTIDGMTLLESRLNTMLGELDNKFTTQSIVPNLDSDKSASRLNDIIREYGLAVYQYNESLDKWIKP